MTKEEREAYKKNFFNLTREQREEAKKNMTQEDLMALQYGENNKDAVEIRKLDPYCNYEDVDYWADGNYAFYTEVNRQTGKKRRIMIEGTLIFGEDDGYKLAKQTWEDDDSYENHDINDFNEFLKEKPWMMKNNFNESPNYTPEFKKGWNRYVREVRTGLNLYKPLKTVTLRLYGRDSDIIEYLRNSDNPNDNEFIKYMIREYMKNKR